MGVLGRPGVLGEDAAQGRGGAMINHHSITTYKQLSNSTPISFAAGIERENNRQRIERERAIATQARNRAYWQTFKAREGETNGINRI